MFGERIDYWLLRPFVHAKGRATEAELNAAFNRETPFDQGAAQGRLDKLTHRFAGHFSIAQNTRYLDVGCGRGDLDIALVQNGAGHVTGIDPIPRNIDAANLAAEGAGVSDKTAFICDDIHRFFPEKPFDVVFSHEALEHIPEPDRFIAKLRTLIHEDGVIYLAFGPLFHSPFGDHLEDFFRLQIPWRGVLFSEKALMKLREDFFRPGNPVRRFEDLSGGMNKMRFTHYLRYIEAAGLKTEYMGINPQLRALGPVDAFAQRCYKIPRLRDYLAMSIYAKLRVQKR